MKSWKRPTVETIERALSSVKKEFDRRHFFSQLKNPLWLQPLVERGYFESPPPAVRLADGSVQFPFWPELQYLRNIACDAPEDVVHLILDLHEIDNQWIHDEIVEIALRLPGRQSARLKPKVLEGAKLDLKSFRRSFQYGKLLDHWTSEGQVSAALELTRLLITFVPDPEEYEKRKRRRKDPEDVTTVLDPCPQLNHWEYHHLLNKGVRSLAEEAPYQVALTLADAAAGMVQQSSHQDGLTRDGEDYSEIWCRRLDGPASETDEPKESIIYALTFACTKVFEKTPDRIADLDKALRNQRWRLFRRLRQLLFALNPTEQTKHWIRELILGHRDYGQWEHHYEFQQMLKSACTQFGVDILTKDEWISIFDAILAGPSKQHFRERCEWAGEEFTEESFEKRQRYFHQRQLRPFATVLFGKYLKRFQELESEDDSSISDEDYSPYSGPTSGMVHLRSPRPVEALKVLSDDELLRYINEWDEERRDGSELFVDINVEALAEAFQTVFEDSIIANDNRLRFWMESRESIERPIYVRMMIIGMQERIEGKNFDRLSDSLSLCEWVLSHPDREQGRIPWPDDQFRENPSWRNARRAVGDLIGSLIKVCLSEDVDLPIPDQRHLMDLLGKLCTQFDWQSDKAGPMLLDDGGQHDWYTEAINTTRPRALEALVKFGYWLKREGREEDLSFVWSILENRLSPQTEWPLTLPERSLLGVNYSRLLNLDVSWAVEHRSDFFPQNSLPEWRVAFGSFLRFNHPRDLVFKVLREDFKFALLSLSESDQSDTESRSLTDHLGQYVFVFYWWGNLYPLHGTDSLLECFYQATEANPETWGNLFDHVGRILRGTEKQLDDDLRERVVDFFEWRLGVGEPKELGEFGFWLGAECLDANWRLDAYSRVLDACKGAEREGLMLETHWLPDMLPHHTGKVMQCFAKLTEKLSRNSWLVTTETGRQILRVGLSSDDKRTRENAEQAQENLLRQGRFDLQHPDDA